MRSIERRFHKITKGNPCWSSYICFAEAIKVQEFSRPIIGKWFLRLVDKSEYEKKDERKLLKQLYELSQLKE